MRGQMKTVSLALLLVFLIPIPVEPQEKVLISYDGVSGFQGPVWAITDLGIGEKYGLAPEVIMIHGGAQGMQALISGSTQFAQISAAPPISIRVRGGDIRIIATSFNKFPFSLVTRPHIRVPKELAGKKIGIVNFG
jgi:ABC-type nitrate/sulfonate/bicarbonate transport system substrate-binding protein